MNRSAAAVMALAGALVSVAAVRAGGWAVVSVQDVPEHLTVGKPAAFNFQIRQHGANLLGGLKPQVEARRDRKTVSARAWETPTEGVYRTSITVPEPGEWRITIASGFGRSRGELLPLRAVDSSTRALPLSAVERGRQLFAAKGCVTCHVHSSVAIVGEVSGAGPDLSDRRFPAAYLSKFLADPSIKGQTASAIRMPNPSLRQQEIASLVAFINAPVRLTRR
jgi:mono/diheme cytochrome c family protein